MPEEETNEEFGRRLTGTIAGTGLEIGAGYGTDLLTSSMLLGGPIGWLGYAGVNFTSGAASNWAAQKLRGEEEISWGEIISSGLIDIIPFFGQKLKGAKGVANVALQSGVRTAAQRQGEETLDEGRWLTPRETLEAAALGGAFGTAFKGAGEGINIFRGKYRKYGKNEAENLFPSEVVEELNNQDRLFNDDATDDMNRLRYGLKMRLRKSIDPDLDTSPSEIQPPGVDVPYRRSLITPGGERHLVPENKLEALKKQETFNNLSKADQQKALDIIEPIDEFAESARRDPLFSYDPASPTKGYKGIRKFTTTDGNELAVAFRGGQWKLVDPVKNQAVVNKRYVWARSFSSEGAKKTQAWTWRNKTEENKKAVELLDELLMSDNPADQHLYSRIAGGTQPFQIEHIANQDSDVWIPQPDGSFRHRYKRNAQGELIAPGDNENLRLVGIYDFKYLKDGIEKKMKAEGYNGKYHLEMDDRNNIVVMDSKTDQPVHSKQGKQYITTIHRSTDPKDGWKAFLHILEGGGRLPLPRAEDVRRTFAEWALDPDGGKAMERERTGGITRRERDIEDQYTEIKKVQGQILKLDPRKTKKKAELEEKLEVLRTKLLEWIEGNWP